MIERIYVSETNLAQPIGLGFALEPFDGAIEFVHVRECGWIRTDTAWRFACEAARYFAHNTPAQKGYRFCPYCGGRIV